MKTMLLLLAFLCVNCSSPTPAERTGDLRPDRMSDLPSELKFSVKNGRGDSLIVHYFSGKLFVNERAGSHAITHVVTPSPEDWGIFWHSVERIHLYDWGSGVDPGEQDFWSLRLSHAERELTLDGTHFQRGLYGRLSTKKEGWIIFASALRRLIHHDSTILRESTKAA